MAEEKAAAESEAAASAPAAGGGGGKANLITVILVVVNLVATLAMGVVLLISYNKEKSRVASEEASAASSGGDAHAVDAHGNPIESKKKVVEFGKMVGLDQFTVNLSTPGTAIPKYLRVNISLELPNPDLEVEINQKMPQVRNTVLDLINSKRATDLAQVQGREFLKAEIRSALNGFLVTGKVKGVYFTNYYVGS